MPKMIAVVRKAMKDKRYLIMFWLTMAVSKAEIIKDLFRMVLYRGTGRL
jgi:hypothetical protein